MAFRLGVDVGGTFTDLLLIDESSGGTFRAKVPSTPQDSSIGVLNGIERVCANAGVEPSEITHVMHGTTVATNAILTGKGARVGIVTTEGYGQMLQIAPFLRARHSRRLDHLAQARASGAAGAHRRGEGAHQRPRRDRPRAAGRRPARKARPPQGARDRGADRLPDERLCRWPSRGADSRDRPRGDARRAGLNLLRGPAGDVRVRAGDHHGRQLLCGAGGSGLCQQPREGAEAAQDRRPIFTSCARTAASPRSRPAATRR